MRSPFFDILPKTVDDMKLNVVGLLAAFSLFGCTTQKDVKKAPDSISGIYPRLAYYNNEANAGRGLSCLGPIVYGWLLMGLTCRMALPISCMR